MIQADPHEQVVNMVLIGLEGRAMLFDTRDTDADGIEDRHGQYAYRYCRRRVHLVRFRHDVVGVLLAKTEDERRQQIA